MHTLRQRGQGKGILLRIPCGLGRQANHSAKHKSESKIQVADPICLEARLCRPCDCCDCLGDSCIPVPSCVKCAFGDEFPDDFGHRPVEKAVAVTIGIFTIVQLERDVQMLIPAYDFCIPDKECSCDTDDPCEAFRKIQFPVDEFSRPTRLSFRPAQAPRRAADVNAANRQNKEADPIRFGFLDFLDL